MISIFKMTEYSMCDLMNPQKNSYDGLFEKATMESGKAEKLVENLAAFFVPLKALRTISRSLLRKDIYG